MGVEIERKFLVGDVEFLRANIVAGKWRKQQITQGYLSLNPKHQVRVRTRCEATIDLPLTFEAFITIKGEARGFSVPEFEFRIPYDTATELLKMCRDTHITKDRYLVGRWEVDFFKGPNRGLVLAEIELESEDEKFPLPFWLGKEVTGDRRYSNLTLATQPYSGWARTLDILG
jgi:CYTH domain-containing protein